MMLLKLFQKPQDTDDLYRLINRYLLLYAGAWAQKTVQCKRSDFFLFLEYLQSRGLKAFVGDLTRTNVIAFLDYRKPLDEPATILRRFSTLSAFVIYLSESRNDFKCTLKGIPLPKLARLVPRGLTPNDVQRLRDVARRYCRDGTLKSFRNLMLLEIFLATGLRLDEIRSLQLEQVPKDYVWLRDVTTKGAKVRDVLLFPAIREVLGVYLNAIRAYYEQAGMVIGPLFHRFKACPTRYQPRPFIESLKTSRRKQI